MKHLPHTTAKPPGPLRKTAALITTAALVGLVLMFSAVLLAIILTAGAVAWAYLWWKTRELRKQMRNFPPGNVVGREMMKEGGVINGKIIEGEAIRVVDPHDRK